MEIISEVGISAGVVFTGVLIVLFGIVVIVLYLMFKDDKEDDFFTKFFGAMMVFLGVLLILSEVYAEKKFRLHVDDTTTVSELKETYKVVRYDSETDLWIVKMKGANE